MTRDLEYNITAQDNGVTISDYLKKQGFSHAVTVQLKKIPESILLNGKWEYMSTRLNGGDCLSIHFEGNGWLKKHCCSRPPALHLL